MSDPPVKLSKIAIGDGTVVNVDESEQMPAVCGFIMIEAITETYRFYSYSCK